MPPRDLCLVLVMTLIWGLNFTLVEIGLETFPPIFFSALRFALVVFPVIFFIPRRGIAWKTIIKLGLVLGVIHYSLIYVAMALGMPAGLSSLVVQTQMIFTVILSALLLRERLGLAQISGILLAFFGIVILFVERYTTTDTIALLVMLVAAFSIAFANIMLKRSQISDMFHFIIYMSLIPPIPLLCLSLIFENGQLTALKTMSWAAFGTLVYGSYMGTILATGILGFLLVRYSASLVSSSILLVPVFGLFFAALIRNETLSPPEIMATLCVMAGLVLMVFHEKISPLFRRS